MNAINWKKLLLPNIPYLLFVYLFDKVGQAVRLAPGADLSGKVLSLADGFSAAFANPFPSLAPIDLLIGFFGAVLIRLIVYVKSKNAKKYRKGIEYGSARWGTAEDIKPYTDPVFQNNVLLTQTERLTMNSRPKQPKYANIWRKTLMNGLNGNQNDYPENALVPYPVILAASKGDPDAMKIVLQHFSGYIASLSMRKLYDERGNVYFGVDEEIRERLQAKLMRAILTFRAE